jgi:hypothetical protein
LSLFLAAIRGVGAACIWFGFTLNTAAAFGVFYRLEVANYGLFYIPFDSAPGGSDCIDVWEWRLHAQTAHQLLPATFLATSLSESKLKGESRKFRFSCFETLSLPSHHRRDPCGFAFYASPP